MQGRVQTSSTDSSYSGEIVDGWPRFERYIAQLGSELARTPFQCQTWLASWYATVGAADDVEPLLVRIAGEQTGATAVLLPLVRIWRNGMRIVTFADLGVTDYNMPMIGPAAPTTREGANALLGALRAVLPSADLLRFEKMPMAVRGIANPLAMVTGAAESRLNGNILLMPGTFEEYRAGLPRKYRKEIGRCLRNIQEMGKVECCAVADVEQALAVLHRMEAMQRERIGELGLPYILDQPDIARHYERLLLDGLASGHVILSKLTVDGELVAALYSICDGDWVSVVRIVHARGKWRQVSPGRLVIMETMKELRSKGIERFDFTIGDYAFKRDLGGERFPLVDLEVALGWRGLAAAGRRRAASLVRRHSRLHQIVRRLLGKTPTKDDT